MNGFGPKSVTLTPEDARRLGLMLKWFDRRPRDMDVGRAKYPVSAGSGGTAVGVLYIGLSPNSGTTAGTGYMNPITGLNVDTGEYTIDTTVSIKVYNHFSVGVAAGTRISVGYSLGVAWFLTSDCPS